MVAAEAAQTHLRIATPVPAVVVVEFPFAGLAIHEAQTAVNLLLL